MLGLLRNQIHECSKTLDNLETRHRRKALLFSGVPEAENEDLRAIVLGIVNSKLGLTNITAVAIKSCHRLGTYNKNKQRPILLRFSDFESRSAVWRAKTKLKGSSVTVKEFLTKLRQSVFLKARQHFGVKTCWTQEGVIVIKAPGGTRVKVTSVEELNIQVAKYPNAAGSPTSTPRMGNVSYTTTGVNKTGVRLQ